MNEHKNITDYAISEDGIELFIDNVVLAGKNGKKGYFCIGCGNEMVAVKNYGDHRNYFRHYGNNGANNKCTWSSETYRHYIAKLELKSYKRVKLPTIWKHSPDFSEKVVIRRFGKNDNSYFNGLNVISGFAHAHRAENEMYFYMVNGVVHYSEQKNRPVTFDKGTLIQPDVTFFNNKNEPALFIEVVATHKPDFEKIAKLVSIGIDTIEILVPKDSKENIIKTIRHESKRTKWTFSSDAHRVKWGDCISKPGKVIQRSNDEDRGTGGEPCCIAEINSAERVFYSFMGSAEFKSAKGRIEKQKRKIEGYVAKEFRRRRRNIKRRREINYNIRTELGRKRSDIENKHFELEKRYRVRKSQIRADIKRQLSSRDRRLIEAREVRASVIYGERRKSVEERRKRVGRRREFIEARKREFKKEFDTEIRAINAINSGGYQGVIRQWGELQERINREVQREFNKLRKSVAETYRKKQLMNQNNPIA